MTLTIRPGRFAGIGSRVRASKPPQRAAMRGNGLMLSSAGPLIFTRSALDGKIYVRRWAGKGLV